MAILTIALFVLGACSHFSGSGAPQVPQNPPAVSTPPETGFDFGRAKKSAHYESNTPAHGDILPAPPFNIVIDFNFDLAPPSTISVTKDGREYGAGETQIDGNALAMRREVNPAAPDGLYDVDYKACWPDGSCHNGNFKFAIDSKKLAETGVIDMRGKAEVTVTLANVQFVPAQIRVSKGTKVTWLHDDSASADIEHSINTDGHPAHTYFLGQNSRLLKRGGTYSAVFEKPGAYPYHCSPHAASMKGMVIVE